MTRIAIAGFQHETNTFATTGTDWAQFVMADSWPPLLTGSDVITRTQGMNLPIAGFAARADAEPDIEVIPLFWCAAEPAAEVTDDAFETAWQMLRDGLQLSRMDALYLDLHGAMVTQSHEDGEGEILERLRSLLGPDFPIVASLDFHANVTPRMVHNADRLAIYRTYPHLDMAETGARCVGYVMDAVAGVKPEKAFRQAPFLVPLHAQCTMMQPCASLYAGLDGSDVELAMGFTGSDIHDAGPSVVAYTTSADQAERQADALIARVVAAEPEFDTGILSPDDAVRAAMSRADKGRPVVLAEVQDNPGGGASADSTDLLQALVAQGARGALMGLLHDPGTARSAHEAGEGATIDCALGGGSGFAGIVPYLGKFHVERVTDGRCVYTGQMYGGGEATFGPSALLRAAGHDIRVAVTSIRNQALDLGQFTHFGVDPRDTAIVCVKSTIHFRADFAPIAATILNVASRGALVGRLQDLTYRRLRPGVRLGPNGPTAGT